MSGSCVSCFYIAVLATLVANAAVAVEMAEPKDVPPLFAEGEARTVEEWRDVRRPAVTKLLETAVYGDISYHLRRGEHDLTPYDWNVYMDFADRHGWRCARGQGKEEAGE